MPQHDTAAPSWMSGEEERAEAVANSDAGVSNPKAPAPQQREKNKVTPAATPPRSLKGMRFRNDYQQRFDELVAREKHVSGKNGPDLIEEALSMLFRKYDKKIIK